MEVGKVDANREAFNKQFLNFSRKCENVGIGASHRTLIDSLVNGDKMEVLDNTIDEWKINVDNKPYQ